MTFALILLAVLIAVVAWIVEGKHPATQEQRNWLLFAAICGLASIYIVHDKPIQNSSVLEYIVKSAAYFFGVGFTVGWAVQTVHAFYMEYLYTELPPKPEPIPEPPSPPPPPEPPREKTAEEKLEEILKANKR